MRALALAAGCAALTLLGSFSRAAGPADSKRLKRHYSKTVHAHVRAEAKKAGAFIVHDDVLNKDWKLKEVRIHADRIVSLGEGKFFACADFKEIGGKKETLDLDFYVGKRGDGWVMEKVLVHKVAGIPRYTYNDKNEMVPAQ